MFFFPASLLSGPSLCIISVFLHFVFNPIHKHVHSYRHHAILVLIPMPYLIVCHVMPLFVSSTFFFFFFSLSSAVVHCNVDLGQSVSASHSHPLQFLHALNAPTPLPCLHFPRFPRCTLRSCPGTPTPVHTALVHLTVKAMNNGVRPTRNYPCHATEERGIDSYPSPQYATWSTRWSTSVPPENTWETDGRYHAQPLAKHATIHMAN